MNIVIATIKQWNIDNAHAFQKANQSAHDVRIVDSQDDLTDTFLAEFNPKFIFFPHWSRIIPKRVFERYTCVVFHMTDLPYGRGGSPLQNLIVNGVKETKISAIRVSDGIDTGPVYLKEPLSLDGSAEEIYRRASEIVFSRMIPRFLTGNIVAKPQEGPVVLFRRRTAEQSEITSDMDLDQVYDQIRMLDAEGYPAAFLRFGKNRYVFKQVENIDGHLNASVQIMEEK